jgi:hypothetical protein
MPVALLLVGALSALGWGTLVARILRIDPNDGERGLLGLLAIGVSAALVHAVVPLSEIAQAVLIMSGLILLIIVPRNAPLTRAGLAAVAFGSVLAHDNLQTLYDNGLYHLQTILWNTNAPLIPGLANLHGRLGFNSLLFLIAAVVDDVAYGWIANAMVTAFVLLAMLDRLRDASANRMASPAFWFLALGVIAFVLRPGWLGWLGVLNADSAASVLIVYSVYLWFEHLHALRPATTPTLILFVGVLTILIKMSAAPVLAAGGVLWALKRDPPPPKRVLVVVAIAVAIWSGRSLALTGCAAYPMPQTCVYGLPWTVSPAQVDGESSSVRSWARTPGRTDYHAVLANWDWFGPWLQRVKDEEPVRRLPWALAIGLVAVVGSVIARRRVDSTTLRVAAALAACIACWFWAAPDPRFGSGFLVSMSLVCVSLAVSLVPGSETLQQWGFRGVVALTAAAAVYYAGRVPIRTQPDVPRVEVKTIVSPSGVPIAVPVMGDQCWTHPVPCIPWYYVDQAALQKVIWRPIARQAGDPTRE